MSFPKHLSHLLLFWMRRKIVIFCLVKGQNVKLCIVMCNKILMKNLRLFKKLVFEW